MHKIFLAGIILLIVAQSGVAQKYLVLEKYGGRNRYQYPIGSEISIKVKGEKFFRRSVIVDLADSVIVFDYGFFSFKNIESIDISGGKGKRIKFAGYPQTLVIAGVLLFVGDQFNETVIVGNDASLNRGVTIASAALVGLGITWALLRSPVKKLKRNWRLRIVDI